MLQQEPSSEETLTSAQIRVTPEELARAIASLEAKEAEEAWRREEEARRNAGTLSLHEAVDNLKLEFSEEQLWEEVQKQRKDDESLSRWEVNEPALNTSAANSKPIINAAAIDHFLESGKFAGFLISFILLMAACVGIYVCLPSRDVP